MILNNGLTATSSPVQQRGAGDAGTNRALWNRSFNLTALRFTVAWTEKIPDASATPFRLGMKSVSGATFSGTSTEAVAVADTQSGPYVAAGTSTETPAAVDVQTTTAQFGVAQPESGVAADSQASTGSFGVAEAGSGAVGDSQTTTASFWLTLAETGIAVATQASEVVAGLAPKNSVRRVRRLPRGSPLPASAFVVALTESISVRDRATAIIQHAAQDADEETLTDDMLTEILAALVS